MAISTQISVPPDDGLLSNKSPRRNLWVRTVRNVDVDISTATESTPEDIILSRNVESYTSIVFIASHSCKVQVLVSNDQSADNTAAKANLWASPKRLQDGTGELLSIESEGVTELYDVAYHSILIRAWPDTTAAAGTKTLSAYMKLRSRA